MKNRIQDEGVGDNQNDGKRRAGLCNFLNRDGVADEITSAAAPLARDGHTQQAMGACKRYELARKAILFVNARRNRPHVLIGKRPRQLSKLLLGR